MLASVGGGYAVVKTEHKYCICIWTKLWLMNQDDITICFYSPKQFCFYIYSTINLMISSQRIFNLICCTKFVYVISSVKIKRNNVYTRVQYWILCTALTNLTSYTADTEKLFSSLAVKISGKKVENWMLHLLAEDFSRFLCLQNCSSLMIVECYDSCIFIFLYQQCGLKSTIFITQVI